MSFKALLAKNAVYKTGNVVVLFATTAILSRAMGAGGFGLLSLLILNAALFNLFTSFGIDSGITYATAVDKGKTGKVVGISLAVMGLQLVLLLVVEGLVFALSGQLWLLRSADWKTWWLGTLFLLSISCQEKFSALLNGSHLYTTSNRTIFLCNLFSLLFFSFFFFVFNKSNIQFYLLLYILANVALALALVAVSRQALHFSVDWQLTKETLSPFFAYSFLVFATNGVQFLAYRADLWFIAFFRNEDEVGWYALAVRLVQFLWILPVLFSSIIFPKVSTAQERFVPVEMLSLLRFLNTVSLVGGLILFFAVKPLLLFFFGSAFAPAVPAFQLLLPGVVLFINATILAAYFAGINALMVNFWGSVLCLVINVLLDLYLIPLKGYTGAAIASSIGYTLTAIYFVFQFCKRTGYSVADLLWLQKQDWKKLQTFRHQFFVSK